MCAICKKFKRGTLSVDEARAELEEQFENLDEEHIEEIEEMLYEEKDAYEVLFESGGCSDGPIYEDEEGELIDEEDFVEEIDYQEEDE